MPFIKTVGSEVGGNTGSSSNLVNYLDKENNFVKMEDKEHFFSHENQMVSNSEVIKNIDSNKSSKLGKDEAKFYMVMINFSEKELKHIGKDNEKLKNYTREVMNDYAKNFKDGKGNSKLEGGKDLVYYAKLENDRYYKGNDIEVQSGKVKQGEKKPGDNRHIHVIVSRTENLNQFKKLKESQSIDRKTPMKLSPLTNHRGTTKGATTGGFDRTNFKNACEQKFDQKFDYKRDMEESFNYSNTMKNGTREQRIELKQEMYNQQIKREQEAKKGQVQEKENIISNSNQLGR